MSSQAQNAYSAEAENPCLEQVNQRNKLKAETLFITLFWESSVFCVGEIYTKL